MGLFLRVKYYFYGRRFMKRLDAMYSYIMREGSITAMAECSTIHENITKDYENRVSSPQFFIDLIEYISVYVYSPEQFKGNKTLEVRCGLMSAVLVIMLIATNKLDDAMNEAAEVMYNEEHK